jgi:DNA-binding MarR family transcriptional regulator
MKDGLYIRVKQALTWLKRNQGILQKDIADKMGMAEASFTRALARVKEKNDEDFVISFHSAVSEYISLEYLLEGEGELVCDNTKDAATNSFTEPTPRIPDMSSVFNSALAKADETIETLKTLNDALQRTVADKEEIIKARDAEIINLKRQLAAATNGDLSRYPFTMGVAEDNKQPNI